MMQHDKAIKLVESISLYGEKQLNEATTRSRLIDTIIYDVLSWPKNAVTHEEYVNVGFTDYILKDQNDENKLIIEAKKEGIWFEVPNPKKEDVYSSLTKMETLLTDKEVSKAINQVRSYCLDTGTTYGAITNGHVWIVFKAFSSTWKELNGFVIYGLEYFSKNFTDANNKFNYDNLIRHNSLENILQKKFLKSKKTYSVKNKISSFDVPVDLNVYAQFISKPVKYYFSDFDLYDDEFLKYCYVDERLYENTKNTLKTLLIDNATPYLENHGVISQERAKLSKKLSKKIANFIQFNDNKHIVIIYGDRGCGKSTFIKKLISSDIPEEINNKLQVVYIDLLKYAAIEGDFLTLKNRIWKSVIEEIDIDNILRDYAALENILFKEEFGIFRNQILSIYQEGTEAYGKKLEERFKEILNDYELISKKLAEYLRETKKHEIVLILDNTDQYSAEIQDFCFQIVAEIFSSIRCLSIITIREERFFRSKNLGVLDAYETTQYHISAPHSDKVFIQRLDYLINSLNNQDFFDNLLQNHELTGRNKELVTKENFQKYFRVFEKDFKRKSNLYTFLVSCAQKDMRKALDLFRKLVVSGYMNINEMISTYGNVYTLQIHQVLKPLMTPENFFYEENKSLVPNIFRLRHLENGSHFTAIRILKYLNKNNIDYFSLAVLKTEFLATFNMEEDFTKNISFLIEYGLIEANIKVDSYIPEIEDIKITPFGQYFIDELIHFFTYLDLVCTDCELYDEQISNFIARSADEEYKLFSKGSRGYRMIKRVEKTNSFIRYLICQEKEELEVFNFNEAHTVMDDIITSYKKDIENVERSALRQRYPGYNELDDLQTFFSNLVIE